MQAAIREDSHVMSLEELRMKRKIQGKIDPCLRKRCVGLVLFKKKVKVPTFRASVYTRPVMVK